MKVVSDPREALGFRLSMEGSAGLVPTMGALHEGHLSLIRRARAENDAVMASIFVNPAQFGPNEDLARYPRDLPGDLEKLRDEGVSLVFTPEPADLYPPGFQTWVVPGPLSETLEGERRPGHFRGVATVVAKLLNVLRPDRAYFGQKDAQQAIVIRRMAADLDLGAEIVVCPIVREADGLAMSSRNAYLSPEERRAATILHRALRAAAGRFAAGERNGPSLRDAARSVLDSEPLANVDYVSAADPETLVEVDAVTGRVLVSLAVRFGGTRLIDNVLLPEGSSL